MSKKNHDTNYNFLNFFNLDLPLDEENDDDDYNVVEDILTSKNNYVEEPFYLSIPKKEVNDVMNDSFCNEHFFHSNENESNSLLSASRSNRSKYLSLLNHSNNNHNSNDQHQYHDQTKQMNKPANIPRAEVSIDRRARKRNINKTHAKKENKEIKKSPSLCISNKNNLTETIPTNNQVVASFKCIETANEENNNAINQMEIVEKIVFLMKQYDFMIQLLIQNLMIANDRILTFRCYEMLYMLYSSRQRIIDNYCFHQFPIKFKFSRLFNENKEMNMRLQLSFFQTPILEILPIIIKFINKRPFTKEETHQILQNFSPFINPLYLPIVSIKPKYSKKVDTDLSSYLNNNSDNKENEAMFLKKKTRRKFDAIADNLLLIGLTHHGKKNLEGIQQLWLPSRSIEEIKHRIKNLTCQSAPDNLIKRQKMFNEEMLSVEDFKLFIKGIEWFGCKNKWNVISKYFLPERSSENLEELFKLLVEKRILPFELDTSNNDMKKNKKKNIKINEELIQEYHKAFEKEISCLQNTINGVKDKEKFYTKEESFETVMLQTKIKNINQNQIVTRGKNNNNNAKGTNNVNNILSNNHKIKTNGFDFQIGFGEGGAYEKMSI